eukprot:TRINITY_DN61014_c0_g1_i1.p1 TRINITY_DN61014_c0_g1~~TRINITY_DN61014_c0_g1_i1.p1  ORF type:complete len:538 (+),score=183.18 TRINITY_DN61014_c0_g1_i1:79-1614(+)
MAARDSVVLCAALLCFAASALGRTLGDCTGGDPQDDSPPGPIEGLDSIDFGDCDWEEYAKARLPWPAIPAVLGVLLLIFSPFIICARHCCCQCHTPEMATPGRVRCVRLCVLLAILLGAGGTAMLYASNTKSHDTYGELFDGVQGVPRYLLTTLDGLDECMDNVSSYNKSSLDSAREQAQDFASTVSDAKDQSDKVESTRVLVTFIVAGAASLLVLMLALFALGCAKKCPCAGTASAIYFFVGGLMLIVAGLAFVTEAMVNDTCPELQKQLNGQQNLLSGLPKQSCDSAGLDDAQKQLDDVKNEAAETACNEIWGNPPTDPPNCDDTTNPVPPFYCQPQDCSNPPSISDIVVYFSNPQYIYLKPNAVGDCGATPNANCTVKQCAQTCSDPNSRSLSDSAYRNATAAAQAVTCIDSWFAERKLDNCTALFNEVGVDPQVSTCNSLQDSFKLLSGATLMLSIALVGAGVLSGCAFKSRDAYEELREVAYAPNSAYSGAVYGTASAGAGKPVYE